MPSAVSLRGERRHYPVRATCLIGEGRQGQSILLQCVTATSQLTTRRMWMGRRPLRSAKAVLREAGLWERARTWFPPKFSFLRWLKGLLVERK